MGDRYAGDHYSTAADPFSRRSNAWQNWHPGLPVPDRRPWGVGSACVLAGLASSLMFAAGVLLTFAILNDRAAAETYVEDELIVGRGIGGVGTTEAMLDGILVFIAVLLAWSLTGVVLAVQAYRGRTWARSLLAVSSLAVAILCVFSYELLPALVLALAAGVTPVLLYSGGSSAWYAYRSGEHPAAQQ